MTGPDSIFRVSGNKCEKVCHVTGHKQSRKTVKTAFHQNTREHLSGLCWGKHGWSRCWGRMSANQLLHGLQTIGGNRMFVSLLSSLSISQMTQFTNVGSGINKIIEQRASTSTPRENWELELGEIKSKWVRSRWFHYSAQKLQGAYIEHLNGFSSL